MFMKIYAVQHTVVICLCAKFGDPSFKIVTEKVGHNYLEHYAYGAY